MLFRSFDNNEINKFYKRSLVTLGLLLVHTNLFLQFLVQTKIINSTKFPKLAPRLSVFAYSAAIVTDFVLVYKKNKTLMADLDAKYTPIWTKITSELQ